MIRDIFLNFNWVDVLIICVMVRFIFGGSKSNILVELLRLLGAVCSTFILLHYYARFGEWLNANLFIPEIIAEVFAFILLFLTIEIIFKLVISGWSLVFKLEAQPTVNQWSSALVAAVRGILMCGLLFVFLLLSGNQYMKRISLQSFSGFYLAQLSPGFYVVMYDGLVRQTFPDEPMNQRVFKLGQLEDEKQESKRKRSE